MPARHQDAVGELRLNDLSPFLVVYRTESVTSAARELGVTPSQVSKAISRLEAALRLRLFVRGARGIALSSDGRQLLPRLEQVVSLSRSLGRLEQTAEGASSRSPPPPPSCRRSSRA